MESTTYLLRDKDGKDHAIFSGDTYFLAMLVAPIWPKKPIQLQEDLAGYLFDSLRNKIMPLADDVIVYPHTEPDRPVGKT